jgi:hypothetical protein
MKKIALLSALILQSVISLYAQSLVSVAPDSALSGTTLYAQITGSNTLFQNSSPNDNVFGIYLQQGGNYDFAFHHG